jgi:hypothetical protein
MHYNCVYLEILLQGSQLSICKTEYVILVAMTRLLSCKFCYTDIISHSKPLVYVVFFTEEFVLSPNTREEFIQSIYDVSKNRSFTWLTRQNKKGAFGVPRGGNVFVDRNR